MIETLTAVAAVVGAVGSLAAGAGVLVVNGKLDRLTGRVDAVESTLQTLMVGLIGRSDAKWTAGRRRPTSYGPAGAGAVEAMRKARPPSDGDTANPPPRAGWADAARRMHAAADDRLLDPPQSSAFDEHD